MGKHRKKRRTSSVSPTDTFSEEHTAQADITEDIAPEQTVDEVAAPEEEATESPFSEESVTEEEVTEDTAKSATDPEASPTDEASIDNAVVSETVSDTVTPAKKQWIFGNLLHNTKTLWIALIAASALLLLLLIALLILLLLPHNDAPADDTAKPMTITTVTKERTTTTTATTTVSVVTVTVTSPKGNTVKTRNGHYICPVCRYVEDAGQACTSCEMGGELSRHSCPGCGGKLFVSDVRPWLYCGYCDDYCVSSDGNFHSCFQCGRNNLSPYDFDPYTYVFGSGICKQCQSGKTTKSFFCQVCGKSSPQIRPADGTADVDTVGVCSNCAEYCNACGRLTHYYGDVDGLCYDCYEQYYCADCGSELVSGSCPVCDATTLPQTTAAPVYYCATCGRECDYSELYGDNCGDCYMAETLCPDCGSTLGSDGLCAVCDAES